MLIKKLATKIIDKLVLELKEEDNMQKLKVSIVDPLITYTYRQMYPYFVITTIIFLLTFILALLIFLILLRQIMRQI